MSVWDPYDFAITHVRTDQNGDIQVLKGRVVEDGTVRDVPIELPVSKAIEYLGYEGTFCTALDDGDGWKPGADVTVSDDDGDPKLRSDTEAPQEVQLSNLPSPDSDE